MTLTKGRIDRAGTINFGDACISLYEEGISAARAAGGYQAEKEWVRTFKRDVFARIVQTLRRIGWTVGPWDKTEQYKCIALNHRTCSKGDLKGELDISGRCIKFEMWQDVTPSENRNGGRFDFDKERRMPYVLRLEMERTRWKIRDYLCNVFTGYTFDPDRRSICRKPLAFTAMEQIQRHYAESWHFKGDLTNYKISDYNNCGIDGTIEHGAKVWTTDRKGRIVVGTAYYNINNMWWVHLGKYDYTNVASLEIYTKRPENPRVKRNADHRRRRLESELAAAVKKMNFERAAMLRDVLFPGSPALYAVWHNEHQLYHRSGFRGYTSDLTEAGKFTGDEVRGWDCAPNKIIQLTELEAA